MGLTLAENLAASPRTSTDDEYARAATTRCADPNLVPSARAECSSPGS